MHATLTKGNCRIVTEQGTTEDRLFESVLRRLSANAFTCVVRFGVRDIETFLGLDPATLVGVTSGTADELASNQQWVCDQTANSGVAGTADELLPSPEPVRSDKPERPADADDDAEIFQLILDSLGTRSRHALAQYRVTSYGQFVTLDADVMTGWRNTGAKTIAEILGMQERLNNLDRKCIEHDRGLGARDVRKLLDQTATTSKTQVRRSISAGRLSYPTPVERRADEPAQWSVLKKTIPELFQFNGRSADALWEAAGDIPIAAVAELPEAGWSTLASIAVYKDDPLDVLLSLTVGYLVESRIGAQLFDALVNAAATWMGVDRDHTYTGLEAMASDLPLVSGPEVSAISNLRIDSFDVPQEALHWLSSRGLFTWIDLTSLTERTMLKGSDVCLDTLSQVRAAWRMRLFALRAMADVNGDLLQSCNCLRDLATRFACELSSIARDHTILLGRWGLLEGKKWSQNELARELHMSQMHVSRICQKLIGKAKSRLDIGALAGLRVATFEHLDACGGACLVAELTLRLTEVFEWVEKPSETALVSLLKLRDDLTIDKQAGIIMDPKSPCLHCQSVVRALDEMFAEDKDERTVEEVAGDLVISCHLASDCQKRISHLRFSEGFLRAIANDACDAIVDSGVVYCRGTWGSRRGSRTQIVESVVKEAARPMHWKDIYNEIRRLHPDDKRVTEHNVTRWLANSANLMLWDRGTYIHRDLVTIPRSLVTQVECWLAARLDTGLPFVSVAGPWTVFEDPLTNAGIPSESALYSCLRELGHPKLAYPRYPYVVSSDAECERLPVSIALEQYILDAGGLTTFQDIKAYAVEELCIAEQLFPIHLYSVPNVIRAGKGHYVHIQNLTLDHARLGAILSYASGLLTAEGHVSVEKVFSDKQISCKTMGIDSAEMLYAVLQAHADEDLQLPGYPQIVSVEYRNVSGGSRGVLNEVADYIALRESPCSFDELEQHFSEDLGYNIGTVYNVIIRDSVVRYSRGSLVHLDTLGWTESKQRAIEDEAEAVLDHARKAGRCYGLVSSLLEYGRLPGLNNGIVWTQTLLAELLARSDAFRILGSARNALIELPNKAGVETFEDLVCELLRTRYGGACDLESFEEDMRNAGIVQKRVTPGMLGDQEKALIAGHIIMLRELYVDAT